jgi:hypothetical protein
MELNKIIICIEDKATIAELTTQEEILAVFNNYRLIAPTELFELNDSVYVTDSIQLIVKEDGTLEAEVFVKFSCLIADVCRL